MTAVAFKEGDEGSLNRTSVGLKKLPAQKRPLGLLQASIEPAWD